MHAVDIKKYLIYFNLWNMHNKQMHKLSNLFKIVGALIFESICIFIGSIHIVFISL